MTFPDGVEKMYTLALTPDVGIGYGFQLAMEFTLTFFLIYVIFRSRHARARSVCVSCLWLCFGWRSFGADVWCGACVWWCGV